MAQNIDYSKYGLQDAQEPNYEAYGLQDASSENNVSQIPQIPNIQEGLQNELPYYKGINNKDILNFFGGASDETNNMLRNALNMLPGVKLQQQQTGSGTAYDIGKVGGDIADFATLQALTEGGATIPYLGKIAQLITKSPVLKDAGIASTLGFLQSPDNKLQNAAVGALVGGGGRSAFEGAKAIPSVLSKLRPTPVMSEALEKIPNQYLNNYANAQKMYSNIFKEFGNSPVKVENLEPETLNHPKIKRFYEAYKENPTVENAHILQSQAQEIGRNISGDDYETNFKKAQLFQNADTLKNAIKKSLGNNAENYTNADSYFRNNVVPYEMISNKLSKLITSQKNPQSVVNSIEKIIKNKGYPTVKVGQTKIPVIPEDIQQYISKLNSTIKNKKSIQKLGIGVGATGAGLEGYHLIKSLFGGEQ